MNDDDTYSAQSPTTQDATMPEKIEINGVTYVRADDWIDERVNQIVGYQEIAKRTNLSLRQATWFCFRHDENCVMPD